MSLSTDQALETLRKISQNLLPEHPQGRLPKNSTPVKLMENALCLAGRRPWPNPIPKDWEDAGVSWQDLRDDCGSCTAPLETRKSAGRIFESPFVQKKLFDVADEANFDARIVAAHLIGGGKTGELGDLLLRAYAAGGWPCGWKGKYPKGHLFVYWPYEEDPEFDDV